MPPSHFLLEIRLIFFVTLLSYYVWVYQVRELTVSSMLFPVHFCKLTSNQRASLDECCSVVESSSCETKSDFSI